MISLQILASFLLVLFGRKCLYVLMDPMLRRGSRDLSLGSFLISPFKELWQTVKTTKLNVSRDLFCILKLTLLHIVLLGVAKLELQTVDIYSQLLILFFLAYLVVEIFQYSLGHSSHQYNIKHLLVAVVLLSTVACSISIILSLGEEKASIFSGVLVSLYCLILLFTGLSLRNSIFPSDEREDLYPTLEIEFARFAWVCIFVAIFNPAEPGRFVIGSGFFFRVLAIDLAYQVILSLTPRLSTDLRWSLIFKYGIPVALASVFGIFVSTVYVQ